MAFLFRQGRQHGRRRQRGQTIPDTQGHIFRPEPGYQEQRHGAVQGAALRQGQIRIPPLEEAPHASQAKVLVTNPTHFAVALDYEKDRTPLPVILAKGQGVLAQRMIETAREEGIPIMRNVPLARSLYEQGTENAYIPQDLIGPVAEVLRWVQSLRQG